jgi:adenine deaminase
MMTAEQEAVVRAGWERQKQVVGLMAASGVPFLVGTDAPVTWAFPGFGIHDELALLVEAGLTPLQALQAATLNPARFLGRTADIGTVAEGWLADLVLLDANPLEDITNTTRIPRSRRRWSSVPSRRSRPASGRGRGAESKATMNHSVNLEPIARAEHIAARPRRSGDSIT